jgi:hypothetical protein
MATRLTCRAAERSACVSDIVSFYNVISILEVLEATLSFCYVPASGKPPHRTVTGN